jgi:type IV secretory pathway VirB2 component (pilin)
MIERRRLTISDMMLGICLFSAVLVLVQQPKLDASPFLTSHGFENNVWRLDATWWLCPLAVSTAALTLLAVSIGARLTNGNARTFLGGMAIGGWLLFGLCFGTGIYSWLSAQFLPLTGLGEGNEPLARLCRGIPQDEIVEPSCGWTDTCIRAGRAIESAACLVFGAACGGIAVAFSRRANSRPWLGRFRNVHRSIFGPLAALALAGTLSFDQWEGRFELLGPIVTSFLVLLAFTWMLALAGPIADRSPNRAFALAATAYLTLAFSPFLSDLQAWLPSSLASRPIVQALFVPESPGTLGSRTYAVTCFTQLVHVATAWFFGCAASYLAVKRLRIASSATTNVAANDPKGESWPS